MKKQNLETFKGATFNQPFRLRNSDESPMDLTGFTATFKYGNLGADEALFEKTATQVTSDGWVYIYVTDEETNLWKTGKYFYVLETESPEGEVRFMVNGAFNILSVANV